VKEKICSLLCTPLTYKERFTGLIYLENDVNYGIFTEDRLRIINILGICYIECTPNGLGSQLMISLENAMLVDRLKQNSIELLEKNEALNELDRMKDEFLAMTSHEFRTPLNGVIGLSKMIILFTLPGMTSLLNETQLNTEQQDYVHHIANSAESLLVLVTDILDFARLQVSQQSA
jgi:signal transduction histidine kinase